MKVQQFWLNILEQIRKPDGGIPLGTIKVYPACHPAVLADLIYKFPEGVPVKPFVTASHGNINIVVDSGLPEGEVSFTSYDGEVRILTCSSLPDFAEPKPMAESKSIDTNIKPANPEKFKSHRSKKATRKRRKKNASSQANSL